jgi:integrase
MPSAEESRDRILTDREIRIFWKATEQFEYPFGPMWRLLLLTGQRRQEISGMTRKELSLQSDKPVWTIPASRTKNGETHVVPLSALAMDINQSLPRIAGSQFCFTTTGETHVTGYSRSKRRLDAAMLGIMREEATGAELPSWTLHDLRRTMASGMAKLGINLPVIEKVLNHTSGSFAGIVGVYQRHEFAHEKRRALEVWASFIAGLVFDDARATIVPIRRVTR